MSCKHRVGGAERGEGPGGAGGVSDCLKHLCFTAPCHSLDLNGPCFGFNVLHTVSSFSLDSGGFTEHC